MEKDRIERIIALSLLFVLLAATVVVLFPFASAILFAIILVVASGEAVDKLEDWLGGRRALAAGLATAGFVACLLVPLAILAFLLADDVARFVAVSRQTFEERPSLPGWVSDLPLIGNAINQMWEAFRAGTYDIVQTVAPYTERIANFFLSGTTAVGGELAQVAVGLLISFFLLRDRDAIVAHLKKVSHRLIGPHSEHLLQEAHGTIIGVLYGVLGTAIVQGLLCAFAFWLAGVPGALLLGVVAAFLSIIPGGVGVVLALASLWLILQNEIGWAIFVILWGVVPIGAVESVIKAAFVSRGSRLPFILILLGLVGGLMAGGFAGLFWGPVVLSVSYRLLAEWSKTFEH